MGVEVVNNFRGVINMVVNILFNGLSTAFQHKNIGK
jgi:hypothetical protein